MDERIDGWIDEGKKERRKELNRLFMSYSLLLTEIETDTSIVSYPH